MKLKLIVFLVLIQVSLAENMQNVTALKGSTVDLRCPISKSDKGIVEWRDPDNNIMFFNNVSGEYSIKDKRYSITKLTNSQFSISIANVTFTDGGVYTCTQYKPKLSVKTVRVTVLDLPRMSVMREGEKSAVKCTAKGNFQHPKITWKFKNEPEFQFQGTTYEEPKTFVTAAILYVYPENSRVTVKCLVHHPDLHAGPLMQFVKVGKQKTKPVLASTSSPSTAQPQSSVSVLRTTSRSFISDNPAVHFSTTNTNGLSLEWSSASNEMLTASDPKTFTMTPAPSVESATTVHSHFNTTVLSTVNSLNSTTPDLIWNDTTSETTNTTGDLQEDINLDNTTKINMTDPDKRTERKQRSSLLVLLVTCLIFALLVVVIFFAIKLRRAHIAWKKENEDSDPSETSNKSKSSQEEKNSQGQRRRGLFNTVFAQYVVEDPAVITSVINPNAMTRKESATIEQTSQSQMQAAIRSNIKETSL
ncbi:cytotoxic and regulatory T-cell molecule isoform X1 [Poecilia reticulata]|uniref:cytotoxic and regulatory T-cell molecule isoform X1 n=1 Tax=Poecilia reticulata TaxID=8081 RepID=UPI0004A3DB6B|nr:PREDICTED: cytotoxic and regulatory T-cell molecule isoform X1 [Poecilia reticulata]